MFYIHNLFKRYRVRLEHSRKRGIFHFLCYYNEIRSSIIKRLIHPYSHEENGLVERANKEVIRHLTAIIADQDVRRNFPDYLPFIQRIMNIQINARIKISPTQMIFGNAINHDSHFLSEPIDNNVNESAIQYMVDTDTSAVITFLPSALAIAAVAKTT